MKKIVLTTTLLLFLLLSETQAQNFVGVKGGISIPNLTDGSSQQNPINSGYSSRLGPDFSMFYAVGVSKTFSLMTQLEYSSQGGKKDGYQAFPSGQSNPALLYATFNSEAKLNYLMLGELAKFNWKLGSKSRCSFYVDAGPFAAYLISAHQVTSGSSMVYLDEQMQQPTGQNQSFDNNENIKDDLHKANFGIEGDVGVAFNCGKGNLFIEGGGNYGFVNIQKNSADGKNNTGAATARLGYAFKIGK